MNVPDLMLVEDVRVNKNDINPQRGTMSSNRGRHTVSSVPRAKTRV